MANFDCPQCGRRLRRSEDADWECPRCGALIEVHEDEILVDTEPDSHGSRIETYKRNHAEDGQDHE